MTELKRELLAKVEQAERDKVWFYNAHTNRWVTPAMIRDVMQKGILDYHALPADLIISYDLRDPLQYHEHLRTQATRASYERGRLMSELAEFETALRDAGLLKSVPIDGVTIKKDVEITIDGVTIKKDVEITIAGDSVQTLKNVCELARILISERKTGTRDNRQVCGYDARQLHDIESLLESIFDA